MAVEINQPDKAAQLATMAAALLGMHNFAELLIAHGRAGLPFDKAGLHRIAAETRAAAKNTAGVGMAVETEAEVLTHSIRVLDHLMETAIDRGLGDEGK